MWSALMTFLFIIATVLLVSSRRSIRELRDANAEAYRSGFMAGHVQGWNDCATAASVQRTPGAGLPAAAANVRGTAWASRPAAAEAPNADSVDLSPRPSFQAGELSPRQPSDAAVTPRGLAAPPAPGPATDEPLVAESAEELQARKERRERQNINVTLYVASLLLVAAGALFVGTSLPAVLRFAGVCLITVLFYGAGLAIHAKAPRLRPAAVAFAGTGLALVPVSGLAMYNFAVQDAPLAWLLTSLVGTLAYVVAAVRLDSRVLAYLSLTFVVSTAWSGVSVLGAPLVWYFAAMIGVAVAATAVTLVKPGWVTPLFLRPIMSLDPFVVPAVALAAMLLPLRLERGELALIMALCGAYFAVAAVVPAAGQRLAKIYGARLALTVAASAWAWHLSGSFVWALFAGAFLLALQSAAVIAAAAPLQRWSPARAGRQHWTADSFVTLGGQLVLVIIMVMRVSGSTEHLLLWAVLAGTATGMYTAVRAGGAAEWAPPAALATGLVATFQLGPWLAFNLLAAATLFWAVRSMPSRPGLRRHFIVAARVAATFAVPALVTAVMEGSHEALAAAVFALSLSLVVQQVTSAVAERAGAAALVPVPTLAGFTAAGALCLMALPLTDSTSGNVLSAVALVVQLLASLAAGALLFPRAAAGATWQPGVVEWLPLAIALTAVITAYSGVSPGLANGFLVLVVLYLGSSALRSAAISRRWAYWWMTRGAATLLLALAYGDLQEQSGPLVIAGDDISLPTVLIFALGVQLVFPLGAAVRDRAPDAVVADVALVLVLQTATLALGVILPEAALGGAADWQRTVTITVMALSAAASGYVFRDLPAASAFAPSMLAVLLVCSAGILPDVELLLGIFAVYSAVMVVAAEPRQAKGAYFASARILTAALAIAFSYDVTASATAVSLTFAGVLAFQHVVRWFMRHRLEQVPFQDAAVWLTLAAQALLPALYLVQGGGASAVSAAEGGRGVVLAELLLLLLGAVAAHRLFAARGALYLSVYAALFGIVAAGPALHFGPGTFLEAPLLSRAGVPLALLAVSLAFNAFGLLRGRRREGQQVAAVDRWFWLTGAAVPAVAAMLTAAQAADWITGAALLVLAATGFTASHVERLPLLYPPSAALVLTGATHIAETVFRGTPGVWGAYLPWLAGCGLAAAVLYGVSFAFSAQDGVRRRTLVCAGALGLAVPALAGLVRDATSLTASLLVAATVAVIVREVPVGMRWLAAEIGTFVVTVAVQRALLVTEGHLQSPFWAVQWYVLLAATMAAARYTIGSGRAGRILLASGAALLGLSGVGILFGGSGGQQLWILALHAALLLSGLLIGERMFVWWGAAGVSLCLMWALRSYTFALLALIAVGLIVFALWKLSRAKPVAPADAASLPEPQPTPDGRQDRSS
ncbi:hypothetical protein ACVLB3_000537 [Pseudarthrobacter sp. PvP022]